MNCYRVADTVFELKTVYDYTQNMLRDYAVEAAPEVLIETDAGDLAREYLKAEEAYPAPYVESLAVYRKLCDYLLDKDVLLFHGSAVAMDGEVYIFTAPSGTGKSTHARLWRQRFGDRAFMVNDDKPLLGFGPEGVTVYGTPWDGKHRLSRNVALPLRAVAILERGEENSISRISPLSALAALLQQAYRPEAIERILPLVERLADRVPIYRLRCNMEPEAAEVAWEGMHGKDQL